MKKIEKLFYVLLCVCFVGSVGVSCSSSDESGVSEFTADDLTNVIKDYADKTVIPTYADMKGNASELHAAVATFKTSNKQEDLDKACEYWVKTRKSWESSEAFLFGPADTESLDPKLDSWPVNLTSLNEILADAKPISEIELNGDTGGFHALEYLLFRDGKNRKVADFSGDREIEYLEKVAENMKSNAALLHDQWVSTYKAEFLAFKQSTAIDLIIDGMAGIADEVGAIKIAGPYDTKNVLEVESWYSFNSLIDFTNNIYSIENAYLGGYDAETRGENLSGAVKAKNEALDQKVRNQITATIAAINAIKYPFRDQLDNTGEYADIEAAIKACDDLRAILEDEVKALFVY
ncbi:MAG: hypothetical protein JKX79_05695 [Labilibaculum sp.]|nr:hypothetical protein [Labilibaculum sp.]